jgi:hypothetical protein
MQAQMEAKLSSMGLKTPGVTSPAARSFSSSATGGNAGQRQSLMETPSASAFLSPDSALVSPGGPSNGSDAAATLAQQRARLKANAQHRISAPGTLSMTMAAAAAAAGGGGDPGNRASAMWQHGASNLGQVDEGSGTPEEGRSSPAPMSSSLGAGLNPSSARPKSTDFAGAIRGMRGVDNDGPGINALDMLSPMVGGNWASQVNTPLNPMFANNSSSNPNAPVGQEGGQTLDAVASRLASWNISNSSGGKVHLDDPKKYRRASRSGAGSTTGNPDSGGVYDDNGNLISTSASQPGTRSRTTSHTTGRDQNQNQWNAARSPSGFSNASSNRYGEESSFSQLANMSGLPASNSGSNVGGGSGLASPIPGLGMPGFPMNMGNMNMNMLMNQMALNGMGGGMLDPNVQAQLLAQIAAANGVLNPAFLGMQNLGVVNMGGGAGGMRNARGGGGRSPSGARSATGSTVGGSSNKDPSGGSGSKEKPEEEVDPKLLDDIPAWFRSLRLHKYTPNFQGMHWRDIVVMDEAALEGKGVAVVGARRKMMKTFELVRAKMGIEMPNPPAIPA